jgi:hypothetical protein
MPIREEPAHADLVPVAAQSGFLLSAVAFDLAQYRVNARTRLNECLRPCRVDHAKNGSSQNRQIRCDGMNFDTPASPLRVSVNVIATIMFGSLGHSITDSYPSEATPQPMVRSGRDGMLSREPIVSAGLVHLALRTRPFLS